MADLIMGIDEAGRGAVCGPMVLASVIVKESDHEKLKKLGAKDSKLMTPSQREEVRKKLEPIVKYSLVEVEPKDIDENNMNHLEFDVMAKMINEAGVEKVYIDAMERNTVKFKEKLILKLNHFAELIAENYADKNYPIVGAASIFAKTTRDMRIEELKSRYGDFGSGYPSDPKTMRFLKEWVKKNRFFPPFVRMKWQTIDNLKQRKLGEF